MKEEQYFEVGPLGDLQNFVSSVPGQTLGIVGGGQLGQMLAASAKELGLRVVVLDPTPQCPAAQNADEHICAPYSDAKALAKLGAVSDYVTFEFENVDAATLAANTVPDQLLQGTVLLELTQNRLSEKAFLDAIGVPVADYVPVLQSADLGGAVSAIGYPSVLKTVRGGYDGKGQVVLRSDADLPSGQRLAAKGPCVLEAWVPFEKEISVIIVGAAGGSFVELPIAFNEHRDGILYRTTVPAFITVQVADRALALARRIAQKSNLVGALAVEMFVGVDGEVYVNELAPRPHNSGHFSIEACDHSQFDLHVRAVCGLPLPQPDLLRPAVMVNILGQHMSAACELIVEEPGWHFHFYGKNEVKPGRKMGHVTVLTTEGVVIDPW